MSLEARLRDGIRASVQEFDERRPVDVEAALGGVRGTADRRHKVRQVAVAVCALLVATVGLNADRVGRFISLEPELPPADVERDDRIDKDGSDETETRRGRAGEVTLTLNPRGKGRSAGQTFGRVDGVKTNGDTESVTGSSGGVVDSANWSSDREGRTEEASYQTTSDPFADAVSCTAMRVGCWRDFYGQPGERWISVEIREAQGRRVRGTVFVDRDGDGEAEEGKRFCRQVASPLRISERSRVRVEVEDVGCDGGMREATSGTIRVTFWKSNP